MQCTTPTANEVSELSKRVDELTKRVDSLTTSIEQWFEDQRNKSSRKDALVSAIIEKTLAGAVWAALAWVAKSLWDLFHHTK
jgi:hypothetical protein